MALVRRFEDLQAWQEARRLARSVYDATRDRRTWPDRSLRDQVRRAATSIVINIAEGFGSGSKREFARFLRYAIRSAAEVQSCLYLAVDFDYLARDRFAQLYESAEHVKSLCSALLRRLTSSTTTGTGNDHVSEEPEMWIVRQRRPASLIPPHVSTSARQHVSTPSGGPE